MAENANVGSRWNIRRGANRLFVVFSVCWYLAAVQVLWPKWSAAITAQREARRIETGAPNADGTHTGFLDEIDESSSAQPKPSNHAAPSAQADPRLRISPQRFLAWQEALDIAREKRPIGLTVIFLFVPAGLYALAAVLMWVGRGFRADPK
jgi:hypothetical protein